MIKYLNCRYDLIGVFVTMLYFYLPGRLTMEGNGAYSMSKHALLAYSDTLRQEMKKWGVHVSIIEPTGFYTGKLENNMLFNYCHDLQKVCNSK